MLSVLAFLAASAASLACDAASRPAPLSPSPGPGAPPPEVSLRVARLEIRGPDSVPPNGSVQLSAVAHLTDGTSRDVTNESEWGSINDRLSVNASGLVTAGPERGEGHITVRYKGLEYIHRGDASATREQFILPAGTYRLYGSVQDGGAYLEDVRVEIAAGSAAGMSVIANGFFRFYGVEGDTEIRVSKDGYETQQRRATITSHHTEEFVLALVHPRPIVEGAYTLILTAAAECRPVLPVEAHRRQYRASIDQSGPTLTVTLADAQFPTDPLLGPGNRFSGTAGPHDATFRLWGHYDDGTGVYPPSLLEELERPAHFSVSGKAVVVPTGTGYAGRLDGFIAILRVLSVYDYQVTAACSSTSHEFVLSR